MHNIKEKGPGWGFKYIDQGQNVYYFDQFYSLSDTKWKSTTKQIGEKMMVGYIPVRRATNLFSLGYCIFWKIISKILSTSPE
jgi:hypothetical protein